MSKKEEAEYEEYESLKNSKFKQQKLPGWRPVPSMVRTIIIYFGLGIVFVGLGVLILLFSNEIVEYPKQYCETILENNKCPDITFEVKKTMKQNIMVYYELDGFYQNHRRYMKSRSDKQLQGKEIIRKEAEEACFPVITNGDMGKDNQIAIDANTVLNKDDVAIPCGLMAKSFFNDEFHFFNDKGEEIKVNQNNISRKSDREKFKNVNITKQWIDIENEHFIVWMRPSPLPNFRKLWGRIETQIDAGTNIKVEITNNYDVSKLIPTPEAKKYLIITTVNSFGGKNTFLAIGCLILGGICIILGIIFFIGFKIRAKKEK